MLAHPISFCAQNNFSHRLRELKAENLPEQLLRELRVCPRCCVIIQRSEGCDSMRCTCGADFNWQRIESAFDALKKA